MPNAVVSDSAFEVITIFSPHGVLSGSYLEVITIPYPLVVTCGNPPVGLPGVAYSHLFPTSGGAAPFTFSVLSGALPPGLTLNPATGVLSGTPTGFGGVYSFTIGVTDSYGLTAQVSCSVVIGLSLVGLRLSFRGVKRVQKGQAPELCDSPALPHVKRAV
jgi:hypothetical protein